MLGYTGYGIRYRSCVAYVISSNINVSKITYMKSNAIAKSQNSRPHYSLQK